MHILEQYALSCGAKIGEAYIREEYYPMPFPHYICLHAGSGLDSKNYDYWQEVMNILSPALEKLKIYVVQIGGPKERLIAGCIKATGSSKHQMAYLIRRSMLLATNDTFSVHLASHFQKKIVCVSSILYENNFFPYWSRDEDYTIISSHRNGMKPSFASSESPKTINFIKPEEVAQEIVRHLNLNLTMPYETVFMGNKYSSTPIHDFVPDQVVNIPAPPEQPIEIRMDIHFDEQNLARQLSIRRGLIVTDRPINIDLLKQLKPAIESVIYIVGKNDDPEFPKAVHNLGIKIGLYSFLSESQLVEKKLNYYEFGRITSGSTASKTKIEELRKIPNLHYNSCKIIHSAGNHYPSLAAFKMKSPMKDVGEFRPVIDNEDFWNDLDFYHIVKLK